MRVLEFAVPGIPASLQAGRATKRIWKERVSAAARALNEPTLATGVLTSLDIVYFHHGPTSIDTDNIIKPIQDALIDVVYPDDAQVTDVQAVRRDLQGNFRLRRVPPTLTGHLLRATDFVYVGVHLADHGEAIL